MRGRVHVRGEHDQSFRRVDRTRCYQRLGDAVAGGGHRIASATGPSHLCSFGVGWRPRQFPDRRCSRNLALRGIPVLVRQARHCPATRLLNAAAGALAWAKDRYVVRLEFRGGTR